jgi:hypothetical protein
LSHSVIFPSHNASRIKMSKEIIFLIIGFTLCFGCNKKNTGQYRDDESKKLGNQPINSSPLKINVEFLEKLNLSESVSKTIEETEYTFFVGFDGNCSSCIISFLELHKKIKGKKLNVEQVKYLYITFADDSHLTDYLLEQSGLKLGINEFLLVDENQLFKQYNAFIDEQVISVILTDRDYNVVASEIPFGSEAIFDF